MNEQDVLTLSEDNATETSNQVTEEMQSDAITVNLFNGASETITVNYKLIQNVVESVINDADMIVNLYVNYMTASKDTYEEAKKKMFNTVISYLINFGIDTSKYFGGEIDYGRPAIDAMSISRAVRNHIMNKMNEKNSPTL